MCLQVLAHDRARSRTVPVLECGAYRLVSPDQLAELSFTEGLGVVNQFLDRVDEAAEDRRQSRVPAAIGDPQVKPGIRRQKPLTV